MSNKKPERQFIQVDQNGYRTGSVYNSKNPTSAAQKAANAGSTDIYLYDPSKGRVYSYEGRVEQIDEPTHFTVKYGINQKAVVKSRGYRNVM